MADHFVSRIEKLASLHAPFQTNLHCIVFEVMDRVFWSTKNDTQMKEVILGDVTGHWVAGILHGNHVESEYMRKGQEVRF